MSLNSTCHWDHKYIQSNQHIVLPPCKKRVFPQCRGSLVDKQFGSKADRIYCGPCYDAQFASRCDACGDVFKVKLYNIKSFEKSPRVWMIREASFQAGMKKMEYKSRQWHEKCFVCCTCKNPIGTKSFIPKAVNGKYYLEFNILVFATCVTLARTLLRPN